MKKWLVFKQEKQSFAMMMQYLNGPPSYLRLRKLSNPYLKCPALNGRGYRVGWATPTVSIKQTKTFNFIIRLFIQKTICDRTAVLADWTPFQSCHSNLEVFNQVKSIYFQIIKKIETKQKTRNKHVGIISHFQLNKNKQKNLLSDQDMNFSMVFDKQFA